MERTLDPRLDVVFKLLFGAPQNQHLLISLLTAVLRPSQPIVAAEVLNPEVRPEDVSGKLIALDISVRLEDGTLIDVEMQAHPDSHFRERALFYWARLHGSQLARGLDYDQLRPTISVLFAAHRVLQTERVHSTFQLREIHDDICFSRSIAIHLIELSKRSTAPSEARQGEEDLLDWTLFLGDHTAEELEEVMSRRPEIASAQKRLDELSESPDARLLATIRQARIDGANISLALTRRDALAEGLNEGLAKGRAEGLAKGRAEGRALLARQLELRFGPLPDAFRSRLDDAVEASTLMRWSERVLTASRLEEVFEET